MRPTKQAEELLIQHEKLILKVAFTYAQTPEDRQDLVQEIKLQVWRSHPSLNPELSPTTWMYRVALNTAISWRRKALRWQPIDADLSQIPQPAPATDNAAILDQLIAQLDPMSRALLLLHLDDLNHNQIGEVLGISSANVATKLMRIRQRLRDLAKDSEHS